MSKLKSWNLALHRDNIMAMFSRPEETRVERAAKIAIKHGVQFSLRVNDFLGDVHQCAKAIMELEDWELKQEHKKRRDQ